MEFLKIFFEKKKWIDKGIMKQILSKIPKVNKKYEVYMKHFLKKFLTKSTEAIFQQITTKHFQRNYQTDAEIKLSKEF